MCGRYTLSLPIADIIEDLDLDKPEFEIEPRYNIAPTQRMPILTGELPRRLSLSRWGLIPSWAKDISIGNKLLNARAETLADKPAFRQAFQQQRCLIPADGFYEWKKSPYGKTAQHIHLRNRGLLTFGGLWESWTDAEGREMRSYTIITTQPNSLMVDIHDRMPVIIEKSDRDAWLSQDAGPDDLEALMLPFREGALEAVAVGDRVNSTRNEGPDLLLPPMSLF